MKARSRRQHDAGATSSGPGAGRSATEQDRVGNAALQAGMAEADLDDSPLLDALVRATDGPAEEPILGPDNPEVDEDAPALDEEAPALDEDALDEEAPAPVLDPSEVDEDVVVEEDTPEVDTVLDADLDGPELVEELEEAVEEAEDEGARPEGILRAAQVRPGMWGAVLGGSANHEVRGGPLPGDQVTGTLADGKPVTVLQVADLAIEVEWNEGQGKRQGWVSKAVFSPQPKLNTSDLSSDYLFRTVEGDPELHSTVGRGDALSGEDVRQGAIANCFFIAAMNGVGNANPDFLRDAITHDESTGLYRVRFFERSGFNWRTGQVEYREHYEVVDGTLPTQANGGLAYARANGPSAWGPIYEKAYAQWQGGYDRIGSGGASGQAMTALTGVDSGFQNTAQMRPEQVIPFFEKAKEEGRAVVAGSLDSMEAEAQAPLRSAESTRVEEGEEGESVRVAFPGPYRGTLSTPGTGQNIKAGTVTVTDKEGHVGPARDTGRYGDTKGALTGRDVEEGEIEYRPRSLTITYQDGKGPDEASDLEVGFFYRGLISPEKTVYAWHAYVFRDVKDGLIELYNPWGSHQPSPLTPEEFLQLFSNVSTNDVPQTEASEDRG